MGSQRRVQIALATMLIVIFGGAPAIVISQRVLGYGTGVALALLAALPVLAVGIAVEVLETDAR
jgi:hypothetical protein